MMEALINNIIKATGWSIFHSLWQGTLLYGLLILIFLLLPRLSARIKHNLAFITLSLMFSCFCLTFFSLFTWPPLSSVSSTLSLNKVMPLSLGKQAEYYFPVLVSLYGIGLLLQVIMLSGAYRQLWKLKHAPKVAVPQAWQLLFERVLKELRLNRNVQFYLSERVSVPLVLGYLKPVVLFPIAFASQLEMAHVEAILIHEMAHIRRNDFLLNIIKTVMETILFFNPFTWLCSSLIEREREHACDDLVVQKTHTPLTYAHALLQIELITEKQTPVLTLAASGNHHNLYQRIKRITDMKTTYNTAKQQLLAITLTVLTLVTLAWINPVTSKTTIKKKIVSLTTTQVSINTVTAVANAQDTLKNKKSKNLNKTKSTKIKGKPAPPPPAPPAEPAVAEMPEPPAAPASINLPALPAPPAAPSRAPIEKVQQQAEVIKKYFQSVDWKKQQAALERSARQIEKKVNSNAWRRQVEIAKQEGLVMAKLVHSPAFKKQMADLRLQSQVLALQGQKLAEQFQAQAWKNQEKDIEIQQQLDVNCEETPAHSAKTPDEQCADK